MKKHAAVTKAWTRNRSDEMAVEKGCWFDVKRAAYMVWWVERYCRLYEGEEAGNPLHLRGCHRCNPLPIDGEWYDEFGEEKAEVVNACLTRGKQHNACVKSGHQIDWQYECMMRLFGWLVDSVKWKRPVRRFKRSTIFVAKKNKKSPTLSASALYMTCGDGEPGQKVFLGAKDGLQAKEIAGKHAIEMVNQSEELSDICTVNKVFAQITHEPSRSILRPISSANTRTQQSKEGLNGSLFIDETHVVDREFIGRVSRMGISRPEPLHAEFSTAGSNPDGYGMEQFKLALQVIAGNVEDQSLFAAVYAAPQDLTDEELDADPLKYGRMANPAMGHTVDPEEFLEDYRRSKAGSISDFLRFKMYRLNIWQQASNPWIKPTAWAKCTQPYDLADLKGRTCAAGLDLAKVYDTTSLSLLFPPDGAHEKWRVWPFFWLPEDTARSLGDKVAYRDWRQRGFIDFTPGDWLDYGAVRTKLNWVRDNFNLQVLGYDPKFSSELIQILMRDDGWHESEIVMFGQTDSMFAGPTAEFERMVLSNAIEHPDHPVLNWQASHVTISENPRTGIKRAMRPKRGDHRTIDGVVATIMGLGVAMQGTVAVDLSYYETNPVEFA